MCIRDRVYTDYRARTGDTTPTVIASTANPYKFSSSVLDALGKDTAALDEFDKVEALHTLTGCAVPPPLADLRGKTPRFHEVCNREEMSAIVSVSYTHLDVYKRQAQGVPVLFMEGFPKHVYYGKDEQELLARIAGNGQICVCRHEELPDWMFGHGCYDLETDGNYPDLRFLHYEKEGPVSYTHLVPRRWQRGSEEHRAAEPRPKAD